MIHDLDWLRYTFGEPERIFGQVIQRSKPTTMDYAQVSARMKSGAIRLGPEVECPRLQSSFNSFLAGFASPRVSPNWTL